MSEVTERSAHEPTGRWADMDPAVACAVGGPRADSLRFDYSKHIRKSVVNQSLPRSGILSLRSSMLKLGREDMGSGVRCVW